jgi:hypothetical protein
MGIIIPFIIVAVATALIASYYKKKQKNTCCTGCCGPLDKNYWKTLFGKTLNEPESDQQQLLQKKEDEKKKADKEKSKQKQIDVIHTVVKHFAKNLKGDQQINEPMLSDIV